MWNLDLNLSMQSANAIECIKDDGVEQQPPTFEVPTIKSRGGGDLGGGGGGLGECTCASGKKNWGGRGRLKRGDGGSSARRRRRRRRRIVAVVVVPREGLPDRAVAPAAATTRDGHEYHGDGDASSVARDADAVVDVDADVDVDVVAALVVEERRRCGAAGVRGSQEDARCREGTVGQGSAHRVSRRDDTEHIVVLLGRRRDGDDAEEWEEEE